MSEQNKLRVLCMDCRTVIQDGPPDAPVSHGLCDACYRKRMMEVTALRTKDGVA